MFKKISNWIKNFFSKKEEMDPHEELMLHVPEPEIPVHVEQSKPKPNHCSVHTRFRRHCPACAGVV
jgi:hypothetical protein